MADELLNGINKMVDESVKEAPKKPAPTTTLKLKDPNNMKQIDLPQKEDDGVGNPIKKGLGDPVSKIRNEQPLSLKEQRKKWREDLRTQPELQRKEFSNLYQKYQNNEIDRKDFNKAKKEIYNKYEVGKYPQRARTQIDDLIDAKQKEIDEVRNQLNPLEEENHKMFVSNLMNNREHINPKKDEINRLSKKWQGLSGERDKLRKQRALEFGKTFNRKDYSQYTDTYYDREKGGMQGLKGNDRIYALFQFADENPSQDFNKIIVREYEENRDIMPDKIEFEDDLYEISKSGMAYDHYEKRNGKWEHISTGTIYGLGDDLQDRLEQENIVENEPKPQVGEKISYDEFFESPTNKQIVDDYVSDYFERAKRQGEQANISADQVLEEFKKDWNGFYSEETLPLIKERIQDKIGYPKGTSKEYTDKVNANFQKALPVLEKLGIKLEDFGGKESAEGGYVDNSKAIMDKYVFEPFRQKYPSGNNEVWEREYKPIYDAIDAVLDKNYNDYYIKKAPHGF